MADRASDEQVAEWREDAVYFGETPRATVELILDELIAERARRDAYPQLSVEWRRDAPCGYPHVDIRHNGMRAVGWVVPDGLEDRLPSFFDGLTWSNPLLPPVLVSDRREEEIAEWCAPALLRDLDEAEAALSAVRDFIDTEMADLREHRKAVFDRDGEPDFQYSHDQSRWDTLKEVLTIVDGEDSKDG